MHSDAALCIAQSRDRPAYPGDSISRSARQSNAITLEDWPRCREGCQLRRRSYAFPPEFLRVSPTHAFAAVAMMPLSLSSVTSLKPIARFLAAPAGPEQWMPG